MISFVVIPNNNDQFEHREIRTSKLIYASESPSPHSFAHEKVYVSQDCQEHDEGCDSCYVDNRTFCYCFGSLLDLSYYSVVVSSSKCTFNKTFIKDKQSYSTVVSCKWVLRYVELLYKQAQCRISLVCNHCNVFYTYNVHSTDYTLVPCTTHILCGKTLKYFATISVEC